MADGADDLGNRILALGGSSDEAREVCAAVRMTVDELAAKVAEMRPPLVWTSNGEAGDGQEACSECGEELEEPHTYRDCLARARAAEGMVGDFLTKENSSLVARIAVLESALRPFAEQRRPVMCGARVKNGWFFEAADLERAAAAFSNGEPPAPKGPEAPALASDGTPKPRFSLSQHRMTRCQSDDDGDCDWEGCPQLRDNEPTRSGRHCPLDKHEDDE